MQSKQIEKVSEAAFKKACEKIANAIAGMAETYDPVYDADVPSYLKNLSLMIRCREII